MSVRVVVVDDEPSVRRALVDLLRADPRFELVGEATDAASAIEVCALVHPDVAVVDVAMPGGGTAAASGIAIVSPGTAVVALSAMDDAATRAAMREAGAVSYVRKGTRGGAVLAAISAAGA